MKKSELGYTIVLVVVLLGVLGAMQIWASDSNKKSPAQTDTATSGSYLEREVGHQLRLLPYYSLFDNLEYKVNGYHVELDGQVTWPALKSDAENVVKKIEGVQTVTNNIKVLPLSPMDNEIRRAEFRAIYGQPSLNRYALQAVPSIHIIVDNGSVTLVGVVANQGDKNIAAIQANGVPNVFSVTNDLQVEGK